MGAPEPRDSMAYDATPLNAPTIDIDARVGWLLATSRLHHAGGEYADLDRFVAALDDAATPVDAATLLGWEAGTAPATYEGMSGYETVLGLEAGRLSSVTGYVRAAIPGLSARVVRPHLDPDAPDFRTRLGTLLEMADAGEARAPDWQDLGWRVAAAAPDDLPADRWEALAHRLVSILPRSIRVPYRQYSTAAMNIGTAPPARDPLVRAIRDYLADPDVQVVLNPLGLLDRVPTRAAAALVLDTLERPPNDTAYRQAVWLAAQKLARDDFTAEEQARLHLTLLRLWRADPAGSSRDLAELVAWLPAELRSSFTAAASRAGRRRFGYVVEHGEEMSAERAGAVAGDLAGGVRRRLPHQPAYGEDRMLARLLREALFHRDSERRHLACLLLAASPFADPTVDVLLVGLEDAGLAAWVRGRMAVLARYLSGERHRMRMLRRLEDGDDEVSRAVAGALGHMTLSDTSDHALRSTLRPEWSLRDRGVMYALGMSGSPGLDAILKSSAAPQWQRSAARWWRRHGSAVRS